MGFSSSANVLSVQALQDLKSAMARFIGEAQDALNAAMQEVRRTLDWLGQRRSHWQGEVGRRTEILAKARAALAQCQTPVRDNEGRVYIPPCTREQEIVLQAQRYLAEAQDELRNVQQWTKLVEQAAEDYNREAQRLNALLNQELPKAGALLSRKIDTLYSYMATSAPSSTEYTAPPSSSGASDAAPTTFNPDDFQVPEPERDKTPTTDSEELARRVRQYDAEKRAAERVKIDELLLHGLGPSEHIPPQRDPNALGEATKLPISRPERQAEELRDIGSESKEGGPSGPERF